MLGLIAAAIVLGAAGRWAWLAWRVRIPTDRSRFVALWSAGTVLGVFALVFGTGGGAAWTAVLLGGMVLFLVGTGGQRVAGGVLEVGKPIPAFTAPDEHGETFDSATLAGQAFMLKFFRGHW